MINVLVDEGCRGVVRSVQGELRTFSRRGVADLFSLVADEPDFLRGASVADRVIGRGAALLLVKGGAREVYAQVIRCPTSSTAPAPTSVLLRS